MIKEYNKWMEVSMLDSNAIKRVIKGESWDSVLLNKVKKVVKEEETVGVRLAGRQED